jgi:nucleoside-diphosphate-sugar epimerase
MTDLYVKCLEYPDALIDRQTFNAGFDNMKMKDIAATVKKVVEQEMPGRELTVVTTPTDDNRSYHVSSAKLKKALGFAAQRSVAQAVKDLTQAFKSGKVPNPDDKKYCNIKVMQEIKLK